MNGIEICHRQHTETEMHILRAKKVLNLHNNVLMGNGIDQTGHPSKENYINEMESRK